LEVEIQSSLKGLRMASKSTLEAWKITTLSEVAKCRNGAGIKQDFFADSGIPLARVSDFTSESIDLANCIKVDRDHAKLWQTHLLSEGDILVATVGSWPPNWSSVVGKVVRVPKDAAGSIQNQNTACLIAYPDKVEQDFLYYLLKTRDFVYWAANSAHGSANQARIPIQNLGKYSFKLPPLPEQRAIAHILGSLDDKIEANRRMNETLEAMARAIFKSWFVDFDPVRAWAEGREPAGMDAETGAIFPDGFEESDIGEIPQGWNVRPIGEVVNVLGGGTPSTMETSYWEGGTHSFCTPKDMSSLTSPILLNTERHLTDKGLAKVSSGQLPIGTVLMSSRAPIGYLALSEIPVSINQGIIAMVCYKELPNLYVLNWAGANMEGFIAVANGSTFLEISKWNFRPIKVLVPPPLILKEFMRAIGPLYFQIINNTKQSQALEELRDAILPRLISGEIPVSGRDA
jgi:type I restriction enzyme S subunit